MRGNERDLVLVLMIHRHELEYQNDGTHYRRQEPESQVRVPSVWHVPLVLKVLQVDGESPESRRQDVHDVPEDRIFRRLPIIYQVLHTHGQGCDRHEDLQGYLHLEGPGLRFLAIDDAVSTVLEVPVEVRKQEDQVIELEG